MRSITVGLLSTAVRTRSVDPFHILDTTRDETFLYARRRSKSSIPNPDLYGQHHTSSRRCHSTSLRRQKSTLHRRLTRSAPSILFRHRPKSSSRIRIWIFVYFIYFVVTVSLFSFWSWNTCLFSPVVVRVFVGIYSDYFEEDAHLRVSIIAIKNESVQRVQQPSPPSCPGWYPGNSVAGGSHSFKHVGSNALWFYLSCFNDEPVICCWSDPYSREATDFLFLKTTTMENTQNPQPVVSPLPSPSPFHHLLQQQQQQLQMFWTYQRQELEQSTDFKNHQLPLARIKKIMKADEDVRMISAEAPILFAKACELFILELTIRSWLHAEENKRRTLQKNDIAAAITRTDIFDFLVDIVPRDELAGKDEEVGSGTASGVPYYYPPGVGVGNGMMMMMGCPVVDQNLVPGHAGAAGGYGVGPPSQAWQSVWNQTVADDGEYGSGGTSSNHLDG